MKGQTQKEMKQDVNSKRDEEKQEVMRKGRKKNRRKKISKCFVSREIHFLKYGRVFLFREGKKEIALI